MKRLVLLAIPALLSLAFLVASGSDAAARKSRCSDGLGFGYESSTVSASYRAGLRCLPRSSFPIRLSGHLNRCIGTSCIELDQGFEWCRGRRNPCSLELAGEHPELEAARYEAEFLYRSRSDDSAKGDADLAFTCVRTPLYEACF